MHSNDRRVIVIAHKHQLQCASKRVEAHTHARHVQHHRAVCCSIPLPHSNRPLCACTYTTHTRARARTHIHTHTHTHTLPVIHCQLHLENSSGYLCVSTCMHVEWAWAYTTGPTRLEKPHTKRMCKEDDQATLCNRLIQHQRLNKNN